jgi:RNA polymerase sigma-70 factor (ECF subfamily)
MTETSEADRGNAGARSLGMIARADIDAWFVREVLPLEAALTQYFRHNWRDAAGVADFLQDVYLRVYEAAAKEFPKSTRPFVFTIARNLLVDRVRRAKVIPLEAVESLEALNVPADVPGPEAQTVARDELRRLEAALEKLPPRARQAFALHHIEGLSVREIAQRMSIGERGVTWHLNEGLRALAAALYGEGEKP